MHLGAAADAANV